MSSFINEKKVKNKICSCRVCKSKENSNNNYQKEPKAQYGNKKEGMKVYLKSFASETKEFYLKIR